MTLAGTKSKFTVIIPTFNEAGNVRQLIQRLDGALVDLDADLLFVDDSTDHTRDEITAAAGTVRIPVRVVRRKAPDNGLGGAVLLGMKSIDSDWCVVMDGDLQHPPELVPSLIAVAARGDVDLVVASRRVPGGSSAGLTNPGRRFLSSAVTTLVHGLFATNLRGASDPLSGFFAVRRAAIDLDALRPRGFKILLEILLRNSIRIAEVPVVLGVRGSGRSKGDVIQGARLARQITLSRLSSLKPDHR